MLSDPTRNDFTAPSNYHKPPSSIQFACAVGALGNRKFTGSNFGCTLHCEFFPHSFFQSSSDGTVTSAFVPQSGTTAGQVGVF